MTLAADPNIHPGDRPLAESMTDTILSLLIAAPAGVTNAELSVVCSRYGARLHDLRSAGYRIVTTRDGACRYRYRLTLPTGPWVAADSDDAYLESRPTDDNAETKE